MDIELQAASTNINTNSVSFMQLKSFNRLLSIIVIDVYIDNWLLFDFLKKYIIMVLD